MMLHSTGQRALTNKRSQHRFFTLGRHLEWLGHPANSRAYFVGPEILEVLTVYESLELPPFFQMYSKTGVQAIKWLKNSRGKPAKTSYYIINTSP